MCKLENSRNFKKKMKHENSKYIHLLLQLLVYVPIFDHQVCVALLQLQMVMLQKMYEHKIQKSKFLPIDILLLFIHSYIIFKYNN